MSTLEEISSALQRGKKKEVVPLVQKAIDEGIDAQTILDEGLLAGMDVVGEKFTNNEVYVPEMLVAARAMNAGTEILKQQLVDEGSKPIGYAVIGTVEGDMHDIGKNLVRLMVESKKIDIADLGVDVSPATFVEYLKEHPECKLVCLSSLLSTTMPMIIEVIDAIKEAGLRDSVKIMIGGAPITQDFADEAGADLYTPDAGTAAVVAAEYFASAAHAAA